MAVTRDISLVQQLSQDQNTKVIFVGDSAGYEEIINAYNFIVGSLQIPEYKTLEKDINGMPNEFVQEYWEYLRSQNPSTLFATIFLAMHQGKNIILFIPPQTDGLMYPNVLLSFIKSTYFINPSDGINPFAIIQNNTAPIADLLYKFNYISPQIYLAYIGNYIDMYGLNKLQHDLNLTAQTSDALMKYILAYQSRLLQANKILYKPFGMEV